MDLGDEKEVVEIPEPVKVPERVPAETKPVEEPVPA